VKKIKNVFRIFNEKMTEIRLWRLSSYGI